MLLHEDLPDYNLYTVRDGHLAEVELNIQNKLEPRAVLVRGLVTPSSLVADRYSGTSVIRCSPYRRSCWRQLVSPSIQG